MKGRITTVLSLAGVLVAGSAAALVNTQVLQNNETAAADGAVTVGSTTDPEVAPPTAATVTGSEAAIPKVSNGSFAPVVAGVVSATQAVYQIGDAGLVTLDTAGDVLTIVAATPSTGWTLIKAENYSPVDIEVKLQSGSTVVEFKANLTLGVVTTSVESKTLGATPTPPTTPTTPGNGTVDDDDESEDHGSEDHDSDEDEDHEEENDD
ncbi:MAG: hypothetical protein HY826_15245 [Actinobacteria bacterium]|nr:hypothetical protein [Actinomycetota bacterium]